MNAINKRHFNSETMIYQESKIISRYDYYSNKLHFSEKRIFKKPNGKLVYIICRKFTIVVPKKHLRKTYHFTTQMAKSYFQQDDMMETKKQYITYCDKMFIAEQKEVVKKLWNIKVNI